MHSTRPNNLSLKIIMQHHLQYRSRGSSVRLDPIQHYLRRHTDLVVTPHKTAISVQLNSNKMATDLYILRNWLRLCERHSQSIPNTKILLRLDPPPPPPCGRGHYRCPKLPPLFSNTTCYRIYHL